MSKVLQARWASIARQHLALFLSKPAWCPASCQSWLGMKSRRTPGSGSGASSRLEELLKLPCLSLPEEMP